ncbi:MAG: GNAT family N-acetyltransferase, partial [Aureliella sp.]
IAAAQRSPKPVLASWMGGNRVAAGVEIFNNAGVATYASPAKAIRAFMYLVADAHNRETFYETPRAVPLEFPLDRSKLRRFFDTALSEGHALLSESTSKSLLRACEIPVSETFVARTIEDALVCAKRIGYPVALKIFSPDVTHKTDVGGVILNLANEQAVETAFEEICCRVRNRQPDARIEGVTVQRMVVDPNGIELIVGAKRDQVFGTVLLVGAGGISAELFHDRALELPPLSERLARRMLESLKSWPLLQGYRGHPAVNLDRLVEVLMRLSYLVADYPEIAELDINPLLVTPENAIALDARIVLDHRALLHPVPPYSHLAIRPYPQEFVRSAKLADGQSVDLRPIKPEDEPAWHRLLASCSADTLHRRFRYMFKATTHELATRFCFVDYDRELAIVVEAEFEGERQLLGVGRLIADADRSSAEFAILIGDPWQSRGVGSLLMDYCLGICRQWEIHKVTAEVAADNARMLGMFKRRSFDLNRWSDRDTVFAERVLDAEQGDYRLASK